MLGSPSAKQRRELRPDTSITGFHVNVSLQPTLIAPAVQLRVRPLLRFGPRIAAVVFEDRRALLKLIIVRHRGHEKRHSATRRGKAGHLGRFRNVTAVLL